MNDEHIALHRSVGDYQEKITQLQREMNSQSQAFSPQEHTAMTLFRAKLFDAESAASIAGAAAGLSKAQTDAHARELSSEYREGMGRIRIQHKGEYLETRIALDENLCEQNDSIEVM